MAMSDEQRRRLEAARERDEAERGATAALASESFRGLVEERLALLGVTGEAAAKFLARFEAARCESPLSEAEAREACEAAGINIEDEWNKLIRYVAGSDEETPQ